MCIRDSFHPFADQRRRAYSGTGRAAHRQVEGIRGKHRDTGQHTEQMLDAVPRRTWPAVQPHRKPVSYTHLITMRLNHASC